MRRIYPNDSERGIRGISRRFLRLRASRMQERFTALLDHFFSARSCKGHSRAHTRSSTYGPFETPHESLTVKGSWQRAWWRWKTLSVFKSKVCSVRTEKAEEGWKKAMFSWLPGGNSLHYMVLRRYQLVMSMSKIHVCK